MRAVKSRLLPSKTIDGARALVGHAEADGTAKGELGPDPADRGCHGDVGRRLRVSQQASKQAAGEEASANHQSWGWAGCGLGWLAVMLPKGASIE